MGRAGGWGLDEILFDWFSSDNGRSGLSGLVSKEGVVKYDGQRGAALLELMGGILISLIKSFQ